MRIAWAIVVVIVVLYQLMDTSVSISGAQSAMQASQLYDGASMLFLGLIAITLAAWYASSRPQQATKANEEKANHHMTEYNRPRTDKPVAE